MSQAVVSLNPAHQPTEPLDVRHPQSADQPVARLAPPKRAVGAFPCERCLLHWKLECGYNDRCTA